MWFGLSKFLNIYVYDTHIFLCVCSTLPDHVFCVQVLVVWDVGISKARNYRLFREVGNQHLAAMSCIHDLMVGKKKRRRKKSATIPHTFHHCCLLTGPQHLPGQWNAVPRPANPDWTLPQPSSPSPRLLTFTDALHTPAQHMTAVQDGEWKWEEQEDGVNHFGR